MSPQDFKKAVENLGALMQQNLPVINEKMALNAYALMRDRIQNEGTIGENKSLGDYSDNPLPAFFFKDKALNASGTAAYNKAKKSGKGISYKEWRKANNRHSDKVTLTFSGTTFKDIGVVRQTNDKTRVTTTIGPKNTKTRKDGKTTEQVSDFLVDRYGDILSPNQEEKVKLEKFLNTEVNQIIKQAFKI